MGTKVTQDTLYIYYEIVISSYRLFFIDLSILNPIPTRLCQVIYCHGDKSYHCLVGIGVSEVKYLHGFQATQLFFLLFLKICIAVALKVR